MNTERLEKIREDSKARGWRGEEVIEIIDALMSERERCAMRLDEFLVMSIGTILGLKLRRWLIRSGFVKAPLVFEKRILKEEK